jgi:hypothetical protein
MIAEFFKGFWNYISPFAWWQGLITIFVVLVTFYIGKYWRNVIGWFGERFVLGSNKTDTLQYRMFWGLVRDVIQIQIKDELRRAMHENHFAEYSGNEYTNYVKDKSKLLISLMKQHIVNLYPSPTVKMKVSIEQVMKYLDDWNSDFEDIVFDIFNESKKIKKHNVELLKKIDADFIEEVEDFVTQNPAKGNCTECLMMMFGKREVAESRKRQVQTIKLQMNIVEQKLIELQSKILTFYSNVLNKKEGKNG